MDANPADFILDCLAGLELEDVRALKAKMPLMTSPPMKYDPGCPFDSKPWFRRSQKAQTKRFRGDINTLLRLNLAK